MTSPLPIERPQLAVLAGRLREPRRFLQILAGPRQVGKTTLARQALTRLGGPAHYATADLPAAPDADWVMQQWALARRLASRGPAVLVLDEVSTAVNNVRNKGAELIDPLHH